MDLTPYTYSWMALVAVIIALAIYRQVVGSHEDETVHLSEGEAKLVIEQQAIGKKVESVERWGKSLTVVALVYGLVLLGIYLYRMWLLGAKIQ